MRIGLLADIHGDVENLALAIEHLQQSSVDKFVLLGDVIYDSRDADETVALLQSCDAVGVWGNHELGLCVAPDDEVRELYSDSVMSFFSTLQPRLELGDVLVTHTFPTEDAGEVLSYYVGHPEFKPGTMAGRTDSKLPSFWPESYCLLSVSGVWSEDEGRKILAVGRFRSFLPCVCAQTPSYAMSRSSSENGQTRRLR
ncbi:metallophosphoesterase [Stieleria sp. ICT_E10.1]|nr:metallophosphoesterase [Stieleria sedimenti]